MKACICRAQAETLRNNFLQSIKARTMAHYLEEYQNYRSYVHYTEPDKNVCIINLQIRKEKNLQRIFQDRKSVV